MPGVLRADRFRDLLLHLEDLRPRLDERGFEARDLVGDLRRVDVVSHDVVDLDREDVDRPARNARATPGHPGSAFPRCRTAIAAHSRCKK